MSKLPYILAAMVLGGLVTLQPGLNADVARRIGSPFAAAFVSILVAFLLSLAYVAVTRPSVAWGGLAAMPWYLWSAGAIGFIFVAGGLWLAPVLGAALLFAALVAGQMMIAAVADQFGVGGYQAQPLDPWRIAGIALVVAGVWLFQRSA